MNDVLRAYLDGVSPASRPACFSTLNALAGLLDVTARPIEEAISLGPLTLRPGQDVRALDVAWEELRIEDTRRLYMRLADYSDQAAARRMLRILGEVLHTAWRLGQIGAEDYLRAVDLPPLPDQRRRVGRLHGDLAQLLAVAEADHTLRGRRDQALIALLAHGLPVGTVCALDLADVCFDPPVSLRIAGCELPLKGEAAHAISQWLTVRAEARATIGLEPEGSLFVAVRRGSWASNARLTPSSVSAILTERRRQMQANQSAEG